MFNKKKCKNCGEKISGSYNFCPYCRAPAGSFFEDKDWGLLGKNDFEPYRESNEIRLPSGINSLFNSLLKNLDRQVKEIEKSKDKPGKTETKRGGIGISIYASGNKPPEIRVNSFGNIPEFKEQEKEIKKEVKPLKLPVSNARKFSNLPKEEPKTNIRRFSDKVVYEIDLPGVKSLEDIYVAQLENSIEIKALAGKKVFHKIIPINLSIKKYNFSKKKLVLELDAE